MCRIVVSMEGISRDLSPPRETGETGETGGHASFGFYHIRWNICLDFNYFE